MVDAAPSDHLLRTLAAVPVGCRVLTLQCGHGASAEPLALMGFDLWACDADPEAVDAARRRLSNVFGDEQAEIRVSLARPSALGYPDNHFHWVIAGDSFSHAEDAAALFEMLAETRRVLAPGGWIFATMNVLSGGPNLTAESFAKLFAEAAFAIAEMPVIEDGFVRGIFRKVDPDTIA